MRRIYFDESGQTGTNLFDAEQPWFVLASTDFEEAEAAEIVARCFPGGQGPEIKSASILKRPRGRRQFLDFAREVGLRPDRFCAARVDKRFAVVCKMVDNLVEPLLRAQGYDFYAGGYAGRFANSASFVFVHLLERPVAEGLMVAYNAFAREPAAPTLEALREALAQARAGAPHGSEATLGLMEEGARHFARLHDLAAFEDTNEIHVSAAVDCMGYWLSRHPGPFEVRHDESVHFFAHSRRWEMMTDPRVEPVSFTVGGNTLSLPLPVARTLGVRSHECASVQLCDLVAGVLSRAAAAQATPEFQAFVAEAVRAGLGEVTVFPVEAGSDFASGPPERARGPDVIDRIASAVRVR